MGALKKNLILFRRRSIFPCIRVVAFIREGGGEEGKSSVGAGFHILNPERAVYRQWLLIKRG